MPANTDVKKQLTDSSLHLSRTFDAPRNLVYKVWTDQQHLSQWFCAREFSVVSFDLDLRIGGEYRFRMKKESTGNIYIARGIYQEITPPSRLVYTHIWEDNCSEERKDLIGMETLVTVDFIEDGDKTIINFTHAGLPDRSTVEAHTGGWSSFLENLSLYLSKTV